MTEKLIERPKDRIKNWGYFNIKGLPETVEAEMPDGRSIVIFRNGRGHIEVPVGKNKVDKLDFDNFTELVDVTDNDIETILNLFDGENNEHPAIILRRSIGVSRPMGNS